MINPAHYWRDRDEIVVWLGKQGAVVAVTTVRTSSPEFNYLVPYDYAIVDFGHEKKEFMAAAGERLMVGDQVKLELRKLAQPDPSGLIEYGLKLVKV